MNSHLNHQLELDLDTLKPKTSVFAILLRMWLPQESQEPATWNLDIKKLVHEE